MPVIVAGNDLTCTRKEVQSRITQLLVRSHKTARNTWTYTAHDHLHRQRPADHEPTNHDIVVRTHHAASGDIGKPRVSLGVHTEQKPRDYQTASGPPPTSSHPTQAAQVLVQSWSFALHVFIPFVSKCTWTQITGGVGSHVGGKIKVLSHPVLTVVFARRLAAEPVLELQPGAHPR